MTGYRAVVALSLRLFGGAAGALSHRNYWLYGVAQVPNAIIFWANFASILWLAWQKTNSPDWFLAITVANAATFALISPVGGALAGLYGSRRAVVLAAMAGAGCASAMGLLTLADFRGMYLLFALVILQSVAFAVEYSARQSLLPQYCGTANISGALGLNVVLFLLAVAPGANWGGGLIHAYGITSVFAVFAICKLWLAFVFSRLDVPEDVEDGTLSAGNSPKSGLSEYPGSSEIIRHISTAGASSLLLYPLVHFLPVYNPSGLSSGSSAPGFALLGALAGGVFFAIRGTAIRSCRGVRLFGIVGGLGLLSLPAADLVSTYGAPVFLSFATAMVLVCHFGAYSRLLAVASPGLRSRIVGMYASVSVLSAVAGAGAVTIATQILHVKWTIAICVPAMIACVALLVPAIRRVKTAMGGKGFAE